MSILKNALLRLCCFGLILLLLSHSTILAEVVSSKDGIAVAEMHGQPMFVMIGREKGDCIRLGQDKVPDTLLTPRSFSPLLSADNEKH